MCGNNNLVRALNPFAGAEVITNNPGVKTAMGTYTPGPNAEEKAAALAAPRLAAEAAQTSAAQSANSKLAARNKRRGASLLATGAGDTGLVQAAGGKSVLGA